MVMIFIYVYIASIVLTINLTQTPMEVFLWTKNLEHF